ncbi:MAG: ankyrin repeat domain-containing protein [Chloroflexota bacterium]
MNRTGKDDLIHALTSGNQERACIIIQKQKELVDELFDDIAGNRRKYSLVHIAAFTGQEKVLLELIKQGADLNVPEVTYKGWTALHFCAMHHHAGIAQILCEHHVDRAVQDRDGKTALDLAIKFKHNDIVNIISQTK